ncbi:MAG: ABC transporter permease subunit [Planctomycetes bacterium]|nr:ABC transporter permease subunit [Planctomycetota bacterium]
MRKPESRLAWLIRWAAVLVLAVATLWLVEPRVGRLWLNTLWLAAGACLIALPLGTLAAVAAFKTDIPGRRLAMLLFVGMLFVPLYIVTGAWDAGFGIQGWHTLSTNPHLAHDPWLHGWRAAIWVHGIAGVPWVVLIVGAGLRSVEAEIEEDAATCASPPRVLWHVSLRRAGAAFVVAALWVAIVATAEISVTDFFQVRTFAEEVYTQSALGTIDSAERGASPAANSVISAAGLWIGIALSTILALASIVAAGKLFADFADAPHRPTWIWRLGRRRWLAVLILSCIVLLVAGVPLGNLIYKAGIEVTSTDFGRVRSWSPVKVVSRVVAAPVEFRGDLQLSAVLGAAAATAALVVGVPLAWSMRRPRRTPWIRLGLLATCLAIPGPLLGVGVIHLLNRPADSPFAFLGWLYDSLFTPWLVQTVRALPIVTLILWPPLASVPQAMLDTAATEGSGWWGRLLRIALPQRWPAVVAAWLVGLAIAVGELAATVLVMPPLPGGATTISVQIFQMLHYGVDDRAAAISLVMVLGIATLTGIAAVLLKQREYWKQSQNRRKQSS